MLISESTAYPKFHSSVNRYSFSVSFFILKYYIYFIEKRSVRNALIVTTYETFTVRCEAAVGSDKDKFH